MGVGVAVFINKEYQEDLSRAIYVRDDKQGSNNIAEWIGCVEAMKIATDLRKNFPTATILVMSDSQIIANQYNGSYAITAEKFRPYYDEARKYGLKARVPVVNWIPREQNTHADHLSKIGLHGHQPDSKHYNKYKDLV